MHAYAFRFFVILTKCNYQFATGMPVIVCTRYLRPNAYYDRVQCNITMCIKLKAQVNSRIKYLLLLFMQASR